MKKTRRQLEALLKLSEAARFYQTSISQVLADALALAARPDLEGKPDDLARESSACVHVLIPLAVEKVTALVAGKDEETRAVYDQIGAQLLQASDEVNEIVTGEKARPMH